MMNHLKRLWPWAIITCISVFYLVVVAAGCGANKPAAVNMGGANLQGDYMADVALTLTTPDGSVSNQFGQAEVTISQQGVGLTFWGLTGLVENGKAVLASTWTQSYYGDGQIPYFIATVTGDGSATNATLHVAYKLYGTDGSYQGTLRADYVLTNMQPLNFGAGTAGSAFRGTSDNLMTVDPLTLPSLILRL